MAFFRKWVRKKEKPKPLPKKRPAEKEQKPPAKAPEVKKPEVAAKAPVMIPVGGNVTFTVTFKVRVIARKEEIPQVWFRTGIYWR